MTTLQNSYTVPMTLEEWVQCVPWLKDDPLADAIEKCAFVAFYAFGDYTIAEKPRDGMVRVSVPRFLELMNDRITEWRLEEVGFFRYESSHLSFDEIGLIYYDNDGSIYHVGISEPLNITTFTDLLTLIRMLTPPSK